MTMPAMVTSSNRDPLMPRHLAVQWVDRNVKKIKGRAAKFLRYSPYDMEDFLQQAYATALVAVDISQAREVPFEACFWILFSAESRMMASNPATRNCFEEFREDYTEEGLSPTLIHELYQAQRDESWGEDRELTAELAEKALSVMTERQREVWSYLLSGKHYSTLEIAKAMKVTRQVIEELRDAGLRRVRRHFEGRS